MRTRTFALACVLVVAGSWLAASCSSPPPPPPPPPPPAVVAPPPPPPPAPPATRGRVFECPKCGAQSSVPGDCPQCQVPFKRQG